VPGDGDLAGMKLVGGECLGDAAADSSGHCGPTVLDVQRVALPLPALCDYHAVGRIGFDGALDADGPPRGPRRLFLGQAVAMFEYEAFFPRLVGRRPRRGGAERGIISGVDGLYSDSASASPGLSHFTYT